MHTPSTSTTKIPKFKKYYFITSQVSTGGKGPQQISSPTTCTNQGQLWDQTRLLRALSSRVLETSKERVYTVSVSNTFQCLTVLVGNTLVCASLVSTYSDCLSSSHLSSLWRLWLHLHDNPLPKPLLLEAEWALFSQLLLTGQVFPPWQLWCPNTELSQVFLMFLLHWETQNWTQYLNVV